MAGYSKDEIVTAGNRKAYRAKFIEETDRYRYRVLMLEGPQAGQTVTVPRGYVHRAGK